MAEAILTKSTIPCCICGTRINANAANMCGDCLRAQCDLSSELETNGEPHTSPHTQRNPLAEPSLGTSRAPSQARSRSAGDVVAGMPRAST
jgi:hypothetical protein